MSTIQNTTSPGYYTSFAGNSYIANLVVSPLIAKDLTTCLLVCKQWNQYANIDALWNDLVPETAFGPRQWNFYIGNAGKAPPLPRVIHKILSAPCPIWPGKKVHETHLLTLIPKTVNEQPLTLQSLGELVQKPLQGYPTKYRRLNLGQYTDRPTTVSHWTLLSRDVIPVSRNKSTSDQEQLLRDYPGYEVPNILDATVAIFMEHVQSGTRLYANKPWTYTQCQEKYNARCQLSVGGFSMRGLIVYRYYALVGIGVGIQRKFYGEKK